MFDVFLVRHSPQKKEVDMFLCQCCETPLEYIGEKEVPGGESGEHLIVKFECQKCLKSWDIKCIPSEFREVKLHEKLC